MASQSQNGNGASDSPPNDERPLDVILLEYDEIIDDVASNTAVFDAHFRELQAYLDRFAERCRNPGSLETRQQLQDTEKAILAQWHEILSLQETENTITERIGTEHVRLISIWSTFDRKQVEERNNVRRHRQDIESLKLEIEIIKENEDKTESEKDVEVASHQAQILSLEEEVRQFLANIQSLQYIRSKHKSVEREVKRVQEEKDLTFARIVTVSSFIENNVSALHNRRMRNIQELRAAMNELAVPGDEVEGELAVPSDEAQVEGELAVPSDEAQVEGEASEQAAEEKPDEPVKEATEQKDSTKSPDDN